MLRFEERLPENRFLRGAYLLTQRYLRHNVGMQSAALAFYLLFMIFPFLLFISALLGRLHLDLGALLLGLGEILPQEVVDIAERYLIYVRQNSSMKLLVLGLVFSFYFPMRATNSLMRSVRIAYHLGPPRGQLRHVLKTLLYTVALILTIVLTLLLMTVGERILDYAVMHFHLPLLAAQLWAALRFPMAALVACCALFFLYALSQDGRQPWRNIWPGTLSSMVSWMLLSLLYSLYVERYANYSLLYGSIGTVIVLLIWLYMSSMTLIMGAELNGTLISLRKDQWD